MSHWSVDMPAAEIKRRLAIMVAVHGEWVRQAYRTPGFGRLSCDCSRCGVRGINRNYPEIPNSSTKARERIAADAPLLTEVAS